MHSHQARKLTPLPPPPPSILLHEQLCLHAVTNAIGVEVILID